MQERFRHGCAGQQAGAAKVVEGEVREQKAAASVDQEIWRRLRLPVSTAIFYGVRKFL